MRTKLLPLHLPAELYERLERLAAAEDRDPVQQARALLRRALAEAAPEHEEARPEEAERA